MSTKVVVLIVLGVVLALASVLVGNYLSLPEPPNDSDAWELQQARRCQEVLKQIKEGEDRGEDMEELWEESRRLHAEWKEHIKQKSGK